jgi:hypothetical protein
MSKVNVNTIEPSTGTDITLGASGDTITVPSGATFTQSGTMDASAITAGTLAIARGGTGAATFAAAGLANTPNFLIKQDGATTGLVTSTWTKVELDSADIDTDSGLDATNKRWTVPADKGGTYFITYSCRIQSDGDFGIAFALYKNGSALTSMWGANRDYDTKVGTHVVVLAATDYVELFAWQSSGSGKDVGTSDVGLNTFMGGFRLI